MKRSHPEDLSAETMNALAATHFGPALSVLSFHTVPLPEPTGLTQVRVKVAYSDLNPVDHHKLGMKKEGTPVPESRSPFIVGFGGSGIVDKISPEAEGAESDGYGIKSLLGARVAFLADPAKSGSYATHVLVDVRLVTPIPDGIDLPTAACVPVAGCTAFESLDKVGLPVDAGKNASDTGQGRSLLIVGGAGGVGSWTTLLARAAYPDLDIVCTASSPQSESWCREMGADRTIAHTDVESLGGGRDGSVDHVVCLAEPTSALFKSLAECLRPYGKICLIVAGDGIENLDLSFIFFKSGTVATETVFSSIRAGYRLDQAEEMKTVLGLLDEGRISRGPLMEGWDEGASNWKTAMTKGGYIDIVGSGHCRGKLVMKIAK